MRSETTAAPLPLGAAADACFVSDAPLEPASFAAFGVSLAAARAAGALAARASSQPPSVETRRMSICIRPKRSSLQSALDSALRNRKKRDPVVALCATDHTHVP